MKYIEKHPMIMIVIGVIGISLSAIFVRYSTAPSAVTAAFRLLWTVLLMTPSTFAKVENRRQWTQVDHSTVWLSLLSGVCLAFHFVLWFESLRHTSVAGSTAIVCTEVIWVSLGFCLFMRGCLSLKAILAIVVTLGGSLLIVYGDSAGESGVYGDLLALAAAVAVAVYTLIGRVVRRRASTTVYTYLVYTSCSAVLLGLCLVRGLPLFGYGFSPVVVGLLLSVFSTLLGHSIFSWCLKYFSPSFVSASKLCEPVVAAVAAGFLFSEWPDLPRVAGGALIIGGVLYYSRLEMKQEMTS